MTDSVHYLRLAPEASALPALPGGAPYRVVVLVREAVSNDWRNRVSEWLVKSGCLYMLAWGVECSIWDDAVDWANIEEFGDEPIPAKRLVMTTWHEDETVEEVFFFAKNLASLPEGDAGTNVILDISCEDRKSETLATWIKAEQAGV